MNDLFSPDILLPVHKTASLFWVSGIFLVWNIMTFVFFFPERSKHLPNISFTLFLLWVLSEKTVPVNIPLFFSQGGRPFQRRQRPWGNSGVLNNHCNYELGCSSQRLSSCRLPRCITFGGHCFCSYFNYMRFMCYVTFVFWPSDLGNWKFRKFC